jgi:hypothetical protein
MSFLLVILMDLEGAGGMGQKLVAPLIILGLPDLMLGAQFGCRLPLQALKYDHGFSFWHPMLVVAGLTSFAGASHSIRSSEASCLNGEQYSPAKEGYDVIPQSRSQ